MTPGTPPAEIEVTEDLVQRLLTSQHPDLAHLSIAYLANGWDNALFRLGDEMIVRMPRRQLGAETIAKEQVWLPRFAPDLPIAIPAPVRVGTPEFEYPWPWSITPYFQGKILGRIPPSHTQTNQLVEFMLRLHSLDSNGAPENEYRGGPLSEKIDQVQVRMAALRHLDFPWSKIHSAWQHALDQPFPGRTGWIHGDLHARNLLVDENSFAAVLDWGDVCVGDPATDLATLLLVEHPGPAFRYYGSDDATVRRTIGWAIHFALIYAEVGEQGDEVFCATGRRMLFNVAQMAN
ncbi:MAG: aminoglycoside phosphotransferase family protein [Fimbriimonadaceae bacterium]|nr:aminoglycoside phosphotransferase family protein [Fimbriimonadaceae bacterium]